jgi:hypothetical protein
MPRLDGVAATRALQAAVAAYETGLVRLSGSDRSRGPRSVRE